MQKIQNNKQSRLSKQSSNNISIQVITLAVIVGSQTFTKFQHPLTKTQRPLIGQNYCSNNLQIKLSNTKLQICVPNLQIVSHIDVTQKQLFDLPPQYLPPRSQLSVNHTNFKLTLFCQLQQLLQAVQLQHTQEKIKMFSRQIQKLIIIIIIIIKNNTLVETFFQNIQQKKCLKNIQLLNTTNINAKTIYIPPY
eukprot:TRINITY_DN11766_c1_g1_i3.p1 TRINITY_DN11766_c1_g1~~TRINITY_DN11766_c1_g1_i3.p1  ORF type:complete len:193 (+),score=-7.68 TRINITY_DN11766_c1_g1_i3:51-629(+)